MITNNYGIELVNVSKIYRSYSTPQQRLMELLSIGKREYFRETRALDDVSFSLEKGARFGIVGENGSGKSTLLKVLAGVLQPSEGIVKVNGRVSALLELGAGFNSELSGRENITQFCLLHGMHRDDITEAVPEIIKFSELGDAVAHPVKTYSSGMAVRLGFACAVYVRPDILIVDEALSVGDAYFQNKCLNKIRSMLDDGVTFIYVTHSADSIRSLCTQGLWLEKGKMKLLGASRDVGAAYQKEIFSRLVRAGMQPSNDLLKDPHADTDDESNLSPSDSTVPQLRRADQARQTAFSSRVDPLRTGSGEIRIDDIVLINSEGAECDAVELEEKVRIRVFFHSSGTPPGKCALAIGITDSSGKQLVHLNSELHGFFASDATPHIQHVIEFAFKNPLCPGEYGLSGGIGILAKHPQNRAQSIVESVVDYCVGGARFSVSFPENDTKHDLWGVVHVDYAVSMTSLD
jgi:lipopolysaccharide transport system ATP-binding protein